MIVHLELTIGWAIFGYRQESSLCARKAQSDPFMSATSWRMFPKAWRLKNEDDNHMLIYHRNPTITWNQKSIMIASGQLLILSNPFVAKSRAKCRLASTFAVKFFEQVRERAIQTFETEFPNMQALFVFDNVISHIAFSVDYIRANKINIGSGGKQPKMRSTVWDPKN